MTKPQRDLRRRLKNMEKRAKSLTREMKRLQADLHFCQHRGYYGAK